jgi:hypothetical protein
MQKPARNRGRCDRAGVYAVPNGQASAPAANSKTGPEDTVLSACTAAADELAASRTLITSLENENTALKQRLDTEKRTTALLTELNETRKSETEALRSTIAAKGETLTAKDAVIASQDKLIDALKRKKSSPWKRIMYALAGMGIGAFLR